MPIPEEAAFELEEMNNAAVELAALIAGRAPGREPSNTLCLLEAVVVEVVHMLSTNPMSDRGIMDTMRAGVLGRLAHLRLPDYEEALRRMGDKS